MPATEASHRIGFGCAYINGGFERRRGLRLIGTAFENGITHFDTAPMYGGGFSENVVGEAFLGKRQQVTIATKVGIARPAYSLKRQMIRLAATPVRRLLPALSHQVAGSAQRDRVINTNFTVPFVQASVEESLRRLRTDYVDILLLHEARIADISEELLALLARFKAEGKVRRIGLGTSLESIAAIHARFPDAFDVYQHAWAAERGDAQLYPGKLTIFHRSIMGVMDEVQHMLHENEPFRRRVEAEAGLRGADSEALALLLLSASLSANPHGLTLFASRQAERIRRYSEAATQERLRRGSAFLAAFRDFRKKAEGKAV